jgi:4-hydroxybenzoate polyprenyltransferase
MREMPRGVLSPVAVGAFTVLLGALFVVAAFRLGPLCGALAPVALAVILGYSYTKRFTWASHLILGLSLAMAPVGGWLAVRGSFAWIPWLLAAAVLLWVAGFDVIYACQDADFDRRHGLHSIPARFGIHRALLLARLLHAGSLAFLGAVGLAAQLHPVYWLGLLGIAALFAWEHVLLRPDDLTKLGVAFFNMNGAISCAYLVVILIAVGLSWAG